MTENAKFKRRVRARARKTGESYTTALKHLRGKPIDAPAPGSSSVRLAVAQTTVRDDPRDATALRDAGREMRHVMQAARAGGARLVHFTEGATCAPNKRIMSSNGPEKVGPSDWSRFEWPVLREELDATRILAGELGIWVVFGSVHPLTLPRRPHNSLYVISDRGDLVTRYDERMLSNTKLSFMYTPGTRPVTFEVDGVRFGCALGMECHFPEVFIEYEQLNADCVLFSTTGGAPADGPIFSTEAQGHAATNSYWISFSVPTQHSLTTPAGLIAPGGVWAAQCQGDQSGFVAVEIDNKPKGLERAWRRTARSDLYTEHMAEHDQRSDDRSNF